MDYRFKWSAIKMTTHTQIEISKGFPVSTGTALQEANERREQLNKDIEAFLAKGKKILVITPASSSGIKKSFNGEKKRDDWLNRGKVKRLIKEHKISVKKLADESSVNYSSLVKYLNGNFCHFVDIAENIEKTLSKLIGK